MSQVVATELPLAPTRQAWPYSSAFSQSLPDMVSKASSKVGCSTISIRLSSSS